MTTGTRRFLALLACAAAVSVPASAFADRPNLEITAGPGYFGLSSGTVSPLLASADQIVGRLDLGVGVLPWLDVRAGLSYVDDDGTVLLGSLSTDVTMLSISAGLKAVYTLDEGASWALMFTGVVDVEAFRAAIGISTGGGTLEQAIWTFGLHPQAGLEAYFWPDRDADLRIVIRVVGGYAWRMETAFDALSSGADGARDVDLGRVDFSGATVTATAGVRF